MQCCNAAHLLPHYEAPCLLIKDNAGSLLLKRCVGSDAAPSRSALHACCRWPRATWAACCDFLTGCRNHRPTKRPPCPLQMTKGNVGSLLVFDPEKISFEDQSAIKSATSDAVVGIVTERGGPAHACPHSTTAVKAKLARRGLVHLAMSGSLPEGWASQHGIMPSATVTPSCLCPATSRRQLARADLGLWLPPECLIKVAVAEGLPYFHHLLVSSGALQLP